MTRDRPDLVVSGDPLAVDHVSRARQRHLGGVQVERRPAQGEQLAAAGAGVGGEPEEGGQPVPRCLLEERRELRGRPDRARLAAAGAWQLGALGRVGGQHLLDPHGVGERLAQRAVHVRHGRRRQRLAVLPARLGQLPVEARQHRRPQALQPQPADPRHDVPLDVSAVPGHRAGLHAARVRLEPLGQEPTQGLCGAVDVLPAPGRNARLVRAAFAAASVGRPPTHVGFVRPVSGSGTRTT
jgi:hypothetical protein